MYTTIYGLLIIIIFSAAALAGEARTEIKFESMPESVRNTVSHSIDRKSISRIEKVSEGDHTKFEIQTRKTVSNKDFVDTDMTVAPDGEIMKLIKEVPLFKIPYRVMQQVNHRYPNLKVNEVEIVMTRHFLLQGHANGRQVNLQIFDDGTVREIVTDTTPPRQGVGTERKKRPDFPTEENQPSLPGPIDELPDNDFEYEIKPLLGDK